MTMPDPDPVGTDRATILHWLSQLYDHVHDHGWLTVNYGGSFFATDWQPVDNYEAVADAIETHNRKHCVWVGIATRHQKLDQGRGGADDCDQIPGLWLDIDIADPRYHAAPDLPETVDDALRIVQQFPLQPTATVHSGHGLQIWWLFNEPVDAQTADTLLDQWEATWTRHTGALGYGLDNVFDIARVLRVPGTINRKNGDAAPVHILDANWTRRYGTDDLEPHLDPPPPKPQPRPAATTSAGDRPGDIWANTHTWNEILTADGATYLGEAKSRNGTYQKWARPGVDHTSGSLGYGGTDLLKVFTDGWNVVDKTTGQVTTLEQNATYSKFGYYAATRHGGDFEAASAALRAAGYTRPHNDTSWLDGTPTEPQKAPPGNVDAATGEIVAPEAPRIPDEFWDARPALAHIRQAAHSRQRSADAVLHVVLARISAITPHTVTIPPIVGAPAPLAYFTVVVAPPGVGKSSANNIAAQLVPAPEWVPDQIPLGSGEGLAETLFDLVEETGDDGKTRKQKRQVKHNGFIYSDEGQTLSEIGGRNGSTLLPTIRTIWTGGVLGQANASIERRRIVPAGSYVFGICIALQPTRAGALLGDVDAGTPQRFGWASATDPTIPEQLPEWPGPLDWTPPAQITAGDPLELDPEIVAEIQGADLARARGQTPADPLDAHAGLYRLKVAGLLCVLDGRDRISLDDWQLADIIKTSSDRVRAHVVDTVRYEAARAEAAVRERHARRHTEAQAAEERRRIVDTARKIANKVHSEPDRWTVSGMRRDYGGWRDVLDDAIEHAIAEGWIVEVDEVIKGNPNARRWLKPGDHRT